MSWPSQPTRTRVLVVEYQPDSNFSLCRLLHHFGCDFDVCRVGCKAVIRAAQFVPHLVLLDMELLGNEGYAVAVALRRQTGPQALIVAVTSNGDGQRAECETAGIDLHVCRPIELETLRILLVEAGWEDASPGTQSNLNASGSSPATQNA